MKVGVEVADTFNVGNYESIRPAVFVEDDVAPGESTEKAFERVSSMAHKLFAPECRKQLSEHVAIRKAIEKSLG